MVSEMTLRPSASFFGPRHTFPCDGYMLRIYRDKNAQTITCITYLYVFMVSADDGLVHAFCNWGCYSAQYSIQAHWKSWIIRNHDSSKPWPYFFLHSFSTDKCDIFFWSYCRLQTRNGSVFLWLLNNNLSRATLFNILTVNFIFGSIHFYLPFLMNLSLISKWNVQCSFCFWNRKTSLQYIELEQLQFWLRIDIKHEFETLFDLIKDTKWQIIAFCHLKQRIHLVIKWNFRKKNIISLTRFYE